MLFHFVLLACTGDDDDALVSNYVAKFGNSTFRPPSGRLKYPYLVPAGYYQQLWDWDSYLTGTALLQHGAAPYLAGSAKNFLSQVTKEGMVKGCLTPLGPSPALYHAKPVLIQASLIAAKNTNFEQFQPFLPSMKLLDGYWEKYSMDSRAGLYTWHDQMESGCDNLVTSKSAHAGSVAKSNLTGPNRRIRPVPLNFW